MAIVGTLGSKGVVRVALGENQTPSLDLAAGHGMASFQFSRPKGVVTVAGTGDHATNETTPRRVTTLSFTVNDNDDTRPLFLMKHGSLFSCLVAEEGEAAGQTRFTFNARATVTHSVPGEGACTFGLSFTADGAVTEATS